MRNRCPPGPEPKDKLDAMTTATSRAESALGDSGAVNGPEGSPTDWQSGRRGRVVRILFGGQPVFPGGVR